METGQNGILTETQIMKVLDELPAATLQGGWKLRDAIKAGAEAQHQADIEAIRAVEIPGPTFLAFRAIFLQALGEKE